MNNIKKCILILAGLIICSYTHPILADNYHSPYKRSVPQSPSPYIAENGSYRGQFSDRTYRPKNDHVRSYQRKDGTHVRGHYKSRRK